MGVTVTRTLNPYFEILGLLYCCAHPDYTEQRQWEREALENGLNGEELFQKVAPINQRYRKTFQKYKTGEQDRDFDFFFSQEEPDFILVFQTVCGEHPEWFEEEKKIKKEELLRIFLREFAQEEREEEFFSLERLVGLLEKMGYAPEICWKLMVFFQDPEEKIRNLTAIVKKNIPAYEKALAAVEKPLKKLLEEFPQEGYFAEQIFRDLRVVPTLVYPAAEVVSDRSEEHFAYVGLFIKEVYKQKERARHTRSRLLPALKALSDASKFEILQLLLKAPRYNLEIAEELKLSAPTVSHHMSVLSSNGLVGVEKRDGRVYYTLSKETLREMTKELKDIFQL